MGSVVGERVAKIGTATVALSLLLSCPLWKAVAAEEDVPAPIMTQTSPEGAASNFRQATSLMVDGSYSDAEAAFRRVLAEQPENVEVLAGLGMAQGRQYKLNEADEQFDKVLALQPNNPVAHCGKAMVLLYRVEKGELGSLSRSQALKSAGRECNKAIDADSRVVEAHYLLGTVFKEEGRLDLAIQAFTGAIRLDPHYVRAYNMLALVQTQKGSLSEASENYKQALSIQPRSVNAHLGLADIYTKQGRWNECMQELKTVISISPKNTTARIQLAQVLENRGDLASAMHDYEEVKAIKPDDPQAFLAIAKLSEKQGDFNRAVSELQEAVKAMPKNVAIHMQLANNYLRAGKPSEALLEYQSTLQLEPDNADAIRGQSVAFYAKSLSLSPPVLASTAEFKAAAQRIAQLFKAQPNNQTLHLADAVMHATADQPTDVTANIQLTSLTNKLLYAELLLVFRRFADAELVFASATNGSTNADDVAVAADTCYALRELDSADGAFRRLAIFAGRDQRAQTGLAAVAAARNEANANLNAGNTLLLSKQYKVAIERFRTAVQANPRLAQARWGLAEALEKEAPTADHPLNNLQDAVSQYRSYLALSPGLMLREQDKLSKHITKLETAHDHLQQNPGPGNRALLEHLSAK